SLPLPALHKRSQSSSKSIEKADPRNEESHPRCVFCSKEKKEIAVEKKTKVALIRLKIRALIRCCSSFSPQNDSMPSGTTRRLTSLAADHPGRLTLRLTPGASFFGTSNLGYPFFCFFLR
ncbi:hypothetical protein AVEN_118828-1, partial [Araneus ventricosus]